MLSPYEFWQFWRNTADADVGRFLKLYTELRVDECERLGALGGAEINAAKVTLANEVTTLCHGAEPPPPPRPPPAPSSSRAASAKRSRSVTLSAAELARPRQQRISSSPPRLVKSGKEAKRLIAERGLRFNNELVSDPNALVTAEMIADGLKVSIGKKRHVVVQLGPGPRVSPAQRGSTRRNGCRSASRASIRS